MPRPPRSLAVVYIFSRFLRLLSRRPAAGVAAAMLLLAVSSPLPAAAQTGTGTADFQGNFTAVSTTSQAVGLARETNCSLTLLTGNYSLASGLTYTRTADTANYDRTLHSLAGLTTTPGVYSGGCASPTTGIGSRTGFFVGTTTTGLNVFAGINYNPVSMGNTLYLLEGTDTGTYTLTNFSFMSAFVLTAADLNKDGNGDLVVANDVGTTSGSVSVLLGNANGSFNTAVPYPTAGTGTVAVVIDDFNNDGKLDIAAVSNDQHISILLGNGDGTFQAAQTFAAPALPGYSSASSTPIVNIISADVNNDGKKDLIGSNGLVLLGNGNGSFTAVSAAAFPYTTATSSLGPNLASGDINKDGKIDLVVGTGSSILTYLGNGNGTFTPGADYAPINSVGYVTVSDLDGDGDLDIYVGMANGGAYEGDKFANNMSYALMGNGDGTFAGAPQLNTGSFNGAYTGTNLGDVNGDGVPDLITPGSSGAFTVQLGNGKGVFAAASSFSAPATFTIPSTGSVTFPNVTFTNVNVVAASAYAVGDINGDSKADLVFIDNNLTALNPNNGNTPFTYPTPVYFTAISNGDGTFQAPVPHPFPQIAAATGFDNTVVVTNLQLADVNKDGKADLIFTYNETAGGAGTMPYNQGIGVLLGLGNGTFSATPVLTSTYSSATAPTTALVLQVTNVADLNNDTKPDVVANFPSFSIATGAVTQLQVFLGNGDGSFQAPKTLALSANVYGIPVLQDFNKDGKLDLGVLAETSASQAELVTALGNGDGTFATPAILNLSGGDAIRGGALASSDFNADSDIDIALLGNNTFSGIFYGTGTGSFISVSETSFVVPKDIINLAASNGGQAIAVDLNKDGKPDILDGSTSLLSVAAPSLLTSTTTVLTATSTTITAGSSVTFTATITPHGGSPTPTGTVTFYNGATQLGTGSVNSSGVATYTTTTLPVGTLSITASYGGDTNFTGSTSSALPITVSAVTVVGTTTALSASATNAVSGTSITFTATVTPASGSAVPAGTVTFSDGATVLGTPALNASGVATYTTTALAVGLHTITAGYGGSSTFSASTSGSVGVTITATPDFSIALSPTSSTFTHGATAMSTVTITAIGSFNAATSLVCSGAPANSVCSVSPSSVTPSSTTPGTATMSFQTSVQSASLLHRDAVSLAAMLPLGVVALLATVLPGIRRRRWTSISPLRAAAIAVVLTAAMLAATGCGGKGNSNTQQTLTTAPGTYTLTITATSGSLSHAATYTATVQ